MPAKAENLKIAMETFLDLPDIEIQDVSEDRDGNYMITAISTKEGTECHKCGNRIEKAYGYSEWITLRHLPVFGREVYIRMRLPRYQCTRCDGNPTTTQGMPWFERRSSHTKAFEERILLACVNSTVSDVALKEGLGYEAVQGIIDRNVEKEVNWETIRRLDVVGIDEISLKKGHGDFVAIVTGRMGEELTILGVLKGRTKSDVKQFFLSMPKRLRRTVQYVCSDMYEGFINAAKEVFGRKVRIVADRFHVAKLYRDGFETLRLKELRGLKRELPPIAYKELKGAMWALRKKDANLTEGEKVMLDKLFTYSPLLKQAYVFRGELTAIFDQDLTKAQAKRRLNGWMARVKRSTIRCFDHVMKTLKARADEITNYFGGRHTSGFVEGLNNKIKVIKRRCYGIVNTGHLFQHIYLDLFGYSLYGRTIKALRG
jgi:transposase